MDSPVNGTLEGECRDDMGGPPPDKNEFLTQPPLEPGPMENDNEAHSAPVKIESLDPAMLVLPQLPQSSPVPSQRSEQCEVFYQQETQVEELKPDPTPPGNDEALFECQASSPQLAFHFVVPESGCGNLNLPPSPPPLPLVSESVVPETRDDLSMEMAPPVHQRTDEPPLKKLRNIHQKSDQLIEACKTEVETEIDPHGEEQMEARQIDLNYSNGEVSDRSPVEMAPQGSVPRNFETQAPSGSDTIVSTAQRGMITEYTPSGAIDTAAASVQGDFHHIQKQMASPPRDQTMEQFVADIGDDLFGLTPPPNQQNQDPNYYPQNPNPPPMYFHQDPIFYPPNPNPSYSGAGASGSNSSSQYHTDQSHGLPPRPPMPPPIQVDSNTQTPDSSVPPSPTEAEPSDRRKRKAPATPIERTHNYEAVWWQFYDMTKDASGKLISARCKVKDCKTNYVCIKSNGLSAFKKHIDKHIKAGVEPQEKADHHLVQTLMNPNGTRTHRKYDESKMLSEFARYIAHKEQSISMGNCLSFTRLTQKECEPMYKRFHYRKMVKELAKQYTDRKNQLGAQFALANYKVSITSDIWTVGKQGLSYFCITAYWIDEFWVIQKRVLSFRVLDSPHNSQIIYQAIMNVIQEYNLKRDLGNKIFSISFDNASNNAKSIEYFTRSLEPIMNGAIFHQKCACHILNLTVKASLKIEGVENLIKRFKNGLTHIFSNNVRKQDFANLCTRLGFSKLRVPWDIDTRWNTRWNSTYRMFHRCLPYKRVINDTLGGTPEGLNLVFSDQEWNQLENLKKFLESFFNATVKLSCLYTPTAHELLAHLYLISKLYREMKDNEPDDSPLQPIIVAMKDKFLKYWEEVPLVTVIANCLHPSFKKWFTVKMLQRYKSNMQIDSTMEEARVNSALEEMFIFYNSRRIADQPSSTSRSVGGNMGSGLLQELEDDSDSQLDSNTNELKSYCLARMENGDVDVMEYWKKNESLYPTLAMMARDIFAVPMSTVPSESCFSSANRILTDKRSKLSAKVFEHLVCLKDWFDAETRMQHQPIEATTSGVESQASSTEAEDSDGAWDPQENDLWSMNNDF